MDRKNQTEHEVLNMHGSRFSGEERARMAQENASRRSRQTNSGRSQNSQNSRQTNNNSRNSRDTARNKRTSAPKKNEGSRNDKVRSSSTQRKKDKKRQNNIFMALLFIAAVAVIAIACIFVLKINTVEVINGSDMYSDKSIMEQSGIEAGESMLLINEQASINAITTNLPYIEDVQIERQWPDKVVINVVYSQVAMVIDSGSGYILLNSSCKVLDDDSPVFTEMAAEVKGVTVQSAVPGSTIVFEGDIDTDSLSRLVKSAEENGIEDISCYDLTKITDVNLMIGRRIEVKLGTIASASEKLGFCREVIKRTVEEDPNHAILIDITSDGTAYARVKDDNHVNYDDEVITEEAVSDEAQSVAEEETTTSLSLG